MVMLLTSGRLIRLLYLLSIIKMKKKSERALRYVIYEATYTNRDNFEVHTSVKSVRIFTKLETIEDDIQHLDERYEHTKILSIQRMMEKN